MRRLYVGANVSPICGMLSLATTLIKPALLSYQTNEEGRPSRAAPRSSVQIDLLRQISSCLYKSTL